jgi:hypothetical protein
MEIISASDLIGNIIGGVVLGYGITILISLLRAIHKKQKFDFLGASAIGSVIAGIVAALLSMLGPVITPSSSLEGGPGLVAAFAIFFMFVIITASFLFVGLPLALISRNTQRKGKKIWTGVGAIAVSIFWMSLWGSFALGNSFSSPWALIRPRPPVVTYPASPIETARDSSSSTTDDGANPFATGTVALVAPNAVTAGGLEFDVASISENEVDMLVSSPSLEKGQEVDLDLGQTLSLFGHTLKVLNIKQVSYTTTQGKSVTTNEATLSY